METLTQEYSEEQRLTIEKVTAAQAGDREAFGWLVERYQGAVYATAYRRLGNDAEAQELSQDVFVQAMRKIDQLRQPECFGGWLRSIAARMAINRAVRRGPVSFAEPETLEATCVEHDLPWQNAIAAERRTRLRTALDGLRTLDRDTLVAFYMRGRSLAEMSDEFESPVGTIKRRLHVARKRLAAAIEAEASDLITA